MRDRLGIPADRDGAVWVGPRSPGNRKAGWYRHTHDELEANLVITGHATYVIGDQRIPITRGSLVWLFPQQEHQLLDLSADYRHSIVVWRLSAIRGIARTLAAPELMAGDPPGTWARELAADELHALETVLADIAHQQSTDCVNVGLRYVLLRLWRAFHAAAPIAIHHPLVAAAFAALRDEALSADAVAKHVGVSADHLRRLVRTSTGSTLVAARQRHQLERFFTLYDPDLDLLSTALSAGFGSYPQFSRVFRRFVGSGPRGWAQAVACGKADRFPAFSEDVPQPQRE